MVRRNTLTNLPSIVAEGDAGRLSGVLRGLPAVIVAAGPSLDRNLPALRLLNGRAVLVAVDTAVRPLLAAGIEPHIVVSVDPSDINAQHLTGLPQTRFALVGEGSLHPTVFPEFTGRLFTFRVSDHHPWPWLRQHGSDRGWLQAWGKKGSGANFRLTLPLRQGEEIDRSPVQLEPEDFPIPGGPGNRNMLVLEAGGAPLAPASTSKENT